MVASMLTTAAQALPAGPLLVIAGPPAAGKTTVSRLVASGLGPRACVLESDFWWTTVVAGFIPPWTRPAHDQNRTIVRSFSAAAAALAVGGYAVVLEGIVGPWNLDLVSGEALPLAVDVHYAVLRPSLDAALARAVARCGEERVAGHPALSDPDVVRKMWHEFSDLGRYESHVVDCTDLTPVETAGAVTEMFAQGRLRL